MEIRMKSIDGVDLSKKKVLLRPDINSPIDQQSKKIVNDERILKTISVIRQLLEQGAAIAIIAHQGDTLDYQNLTDLQAHANKISNLIGKPVEYLDDVCGPAAVARVRELRAGEVVILGNLRYLTEEVSTFEKDVKMDAVGYLQTWLIRRLAPLFDCYVNEAFSAAHRNSPSMVAFQELLPSYAGPLLFQEVDALSNILNNARKPAIFLLGGAKISDAFGMMKAVLENGTADKILTAGVTALVMMIAAGHDLGAPTLKFLQERDLLRFVEDSKYYLKEFPEKILMPVDLAYEKAGRREEASLAALPADVHFSDIGQKTVLRYQEILLKAATIFANGPAGIYENPLFENGTNGLWQAVADSPAYSVIGGGDTITSAERFIDTSRISYISTGGGAMVRFMTGKKLPLIAAMEKAWQRDR